MRTVTYGGVSYAAAPAETVLDTLLRHGLSIPNSCRAGACQSCMLRAASGRVPAEAQRGLKTTIAAQGYFLSCSCTPEDDLRIEPAGGLEVDASIASLERLSPTVLRARLRLPVPIEYRSGQYITVRRPDGLSRSYSLASLPHEDTLELHVRLAPHGRMSGWLFNEARAGDVLRVRGPAGDCFYTAGMADRPMLLVGTGTGLAPLAGICRDALGQGHTGPIHLYHGSRSADGLYFQAELLSLVAAHANFHYSPVVPADGGSTDALLATLAERHPSLAGWRGYVCGNPEAVKAIRKKMFMQGMPSREIFADAFLEAPKPDN